MIPWISLILIVLTLVGIAVGRIPGWRMNRATVALAGATALIALGAIHLEEAYAAVDLDTIVLLFGMMTLNVNLRLAGFFRLVTARVVGWARSPRQLLALVIGAGGILSALFLNDTIVLMMTPLVVQITLHLRRNPLPYLIGLATAANIGSAMTIVGNPQNMIIGVASQIPFLTFTAYLAPVSLVGMGIAWGVIALIYRDEFGRGGSSLRMEEPMAVGRIYRPLLRKATLITGGMVVSFALGAPIPLAALGAAALLLITRRVKPERVFQEVDWGLLVFFSSLFVVTGAVESSGWSGRLFDLMEPLINRGILPLTLVAAVLSNLVSNVPATLLFRPLVGELTNPQQSWLVLAMATTLAGNFTLLGSVANLIVAELAQAQGVRVSFREYLRAGIPITLLTLTWGVVWLMWVG
jgi:Na+/H+ antiporter NhaD/arsenite permease-like protein